MNIHSLIARKAWMLTPGMIDAYLPLAMRLMQGEAVSFPAQPPAAVRALLPDTGKMVAMADDYEDDGQWSDPMPETQVVMIYPVKGMITKEDQDCGPSGTETLMRRLKMYDAMPEVAGHIFEMDSGGGEATNIETVARCIQALQKPTICWFNGYCASAAYYMAAACNEIYASQETDRVGSVGVLVSFADMRPYFEKDGVVFHDIYADQSELKNKEFNEAYEGNYEPLKNEMLNPFAARFIATVQEFRPQLQDDDAYKGKLYMTPDAIRIGMINGMATFDQVVSRMQVLITEKKSNMGLQTLFGGNKPAANAEGMTPQNATPDVSAEIQAVEQKLTAMSAELAELRAELTQMRESVTSTEARLDQIAAARAVLPGAAPAASAAVDADPPLFASGEEDALAAFERQIANAAAANEKVRLS